MASVVLVADMVRGFCEEGHPLYAGPPVREIIPRVRRLLAEEREKGSRIIFIADTHAADDAEFRMFPPHCIRGSEETEVIPELREFAAEIVPKSRFSAFYGTDLDRRLEAQKPDKVIVVGTCTNICVLYTVADARFRDYLVEVPADCVASFDAEAHDFALRQMETVLGAKVTVVPAR
ncbi:MAG TPA: isochorismatase family cysteine hydrolase [Dehalococcoidia bacterium]|nr:isochorismatase family cysteine hydrolase [Dehalococcoidia bacterium]